MNACPECYGASISEHVTHYGVAWFYCDDCGAHWVRIELDDPRLGTVAPPTNLRELVQQTREGEG